MKYIIIKIQLIFFLFIITYNFAFSGYPLRIPLKMINDSGQTFTKLVFGIDEKATTGVDSMLGEFALPPLIPPEGVFSAWFEFIDSSGITPEGYWSYINYLPLVKTSHFIYRYKVSFLRGYGNNVTFSWDNLPPEIDSAKLTDIVTEKVYNVDMKKNLKAIVTNLGITDLYLHIWFNNIGNDVKNDNDEKSKDNILVFPNPCSSIITVLFEDEYMEYKIYSIDGCEIINGSITGKSFQLNMNDFPISTYYINFIKRDGSKTIKKILKI